MAIFAEFMENKCIIYQYLRDYIRWLDTFAFVMVWRMVTKPAMSWPVA